MVYHPQYQVKIDKTILQKLKHYNFFKEIKEKSDFIVFFHGRQNGIFEEEEFKVYEKGNDKLIKGFHDFIKLGLARNPTLVLFEYGMNIKFSKDLIKELGIEKHVIWAPKMDRKEIMMGIKFADVGAGQFQNSWLTCGAVNEIISAKRPLLHYRKDELYLDEYPWLYPLLNAYTVEEITEQLSFAYSNPSKLNEMSTTAFKWLEEFTVKKPVDKIVELIENRTVNEVDNIMIQKSKAISRKIKSKVLQSKIKEKVFRGNKT